MGWNLDNLTYLIICTVFPTFCYVKYDIFVKTSINNCFQQPCTANWLTLTLKDTFCTILPQGYFFVFSTRAETKMWHWDEAIMKIHKKIKIDIPEIGTVCFNFHYIVNLELKFWGYNEKKIGFHLTPKYFFWLSPGGWECD